MTRARLLWLSLLLLLPACDSLNEPAGGCLLAAANKREVLLARGYLNPAIPARILGVRANGAAGGHAVLIYHLDGGWFAWDDTFLGRALHVGNASTPPAPITAARAAFPRWQIAAAVWLDPER